MRSAASHVRIAAMRNEEVDMMERTMNRAKDSGAVESSAAMGENAVPCSGISNDLKARRLTIRWTKKIFVCSPYRPKSKDPKIAKQQLEANINRAMLACKYITSIGYIPMCPHLYFTGFLDDSDCLERQLGLSFAQDWLLDCDEIWVFGDEITEGMSDELETARNWDIPISYMGEPALTIINLMKAVKGMNGMNGIGRAFDEHAVNLESTKNDEEE